MDIKISENLRALRIKSKRTLEDVGEIIDVSLDALVNKTISELINDDSQEKNICLD